MRWNLVQLVVFSLICISSHAGRITHTYYFSNPQTGLIGGYETVNFNNTLLTAMPGQPVLPYQQVKLLLPPGESAISIEIEGSNLKELSGRFELFPQQEVQSYSNTDKKKFVKDELLYSRNATYPGNPKGKLITSFLNGQAFALSSFTPMRYNPVTGKVSYYAEVNVTVQTQTDQNAQKALKNLTSKATTSYDFADNPGMNLNFKTFRQPLTDGYELLIVCTSAFSTAFNELINEYLKQGIRSEVATIETIGSTMTGIDIQEKIRNYIIQEYQTNEIEHVLLAGDVELVPARGFYCYVQSGSGYTDSNIPSDLYYSALDGNWNNDGDSYWAEPGEDDLLPDISVGRLPFSNTDELNHQLHKSISYQNTPVLGEFRNVLMAGEHLYPAPYLTWGSYYLELLIGNRSDNGYQTNGTPSDFNFDKLYDENATWSKQTLMNHLNQGRPMLHHVGHANQTYAMKMTNTDITNANFAGMNGIDHNYSVVYSHGCLCGAFDYNDCIAEKMITIDNFAAAFVGNSRYGWFNEGTNEGPSAHLHREFVDALYNDKLNRIGRAHMESKIETSAWVTAPGQWEPGALRWCFYDCNVLGDPAMAIFTDNPIDVQVSYLTHIANQTIEVKLKMNDTNIFDYQCVVIENGILLGKSATNANGEATVTLNPGIIDPDAVRLYVSGLNLVPQGHQIAKSYTWIGANGNWSSPSNWSPSRNNPAANDILIFDGSISTVNIDIAADEQIGKLQLTNNASVAFSSAFDQRKISIGAAEIIDPHIDISAGSSLSITGNNTLTLSVIEDATASIFGSLTFNHSGHRLSASENASVVFYSGSWFTADTNFSGNAFGNNTTNSVTFKSGSNYFHKGGSAPFALGSPSTVVVFEPGSFYHFTAATGAPELEGRIYGNLIIDSGSAALNNLTGTGNLSFQNIEITNGSMGLNTTGQIEIKGDIVVDEGSSLTFNPGNPVSIVLNGTGAQQITGEGDLIFGQNATIVVNNTSTVTLNKKINITNLIINAGNFIINE
jgi:hypothetical protein